jgi:hypothetical protein
MLIYVIIMTANFLLWAPPVQGESYTLPGETTRPSSEGLVTGTPGLVGVFYGHLPCSDCQRQKTLLILFSDPQLGTPKAYTLERIRVGKGNRRHITKGTWSQVTDRNRPGAAIYALDDQAPRDLRRFWAIDSSTLLVLEDDFKVRRSTLDDPYTAAYMLHAQQCDQKKGCFNE